MSQTLFSIAFALVTLNLFCICFSRSKLNKNTGKEIFALTGSNLQIKDTRSGFGQISYPEVVEVILDKRRNGFVSVLVRPSGNFF